MVLNLLWLTRGVANTGQDIAVLDNAFALIDGHMNRPGQWLFSLPREIRAGELQHPARAEVPNLLHGCREGGDARHAYCPTVGRPERVLRSRSTQASLFLKQPQVLADTIACGLFSSRRLTGRRCRRRNVPRNLRLHQHAVGGLRLESLRHGRKQTGIVHLPVDRRMP